MEKPDYVYIMYPVPVKMLSELPLPFLPSQDETTVPMSEDDSFVPLWYGNARFPEDDI